MKKGRPGWGALSSWGIIPNVVRMTSVGVISDWSSRVFGRFHRFILLNQFHQRPPQRLNYFNDESNRANNMVGVFLR